MCGINGILYFNNSNRGHSEEHHRKNIRRMNDAIAHRGPDGEGVFVQYPVCLGHRRLSILDLSENGAQPMFNEDKSIAIVFNGEIYNYLELIPDLINKGHIFRSKSDTEVIIHAYEEYGSNCVKKFNGMWSFVLYDFKKNVLFASRDRFGVKPFYYYRDQDRFIFSSEIKAILKIKNVNAANHGKIYDYLAYGYKTNNGETFFQDISELESAHNLTICDSKLSFSKYWEFEADADHSPSPGSLSDLSERFEYLLADATRLRFRSDVPVAMLLSGGLDSTSITRLVDNLIESRALDYKEVRAYSAVFPGFAYDEGDAIRGFIKTCKHIQLQQVSPDGQQLLNSIDRFAYGMGEPVFSSTSFAHYALMKEIKSNGVKVVINGQGSDEALCGYDRYIIGYFLLDILFSATGDLRNQVSAIHRKLKYPYSYIFAQLLKAALPRRTASYLRGRLQEGVVGCLNGDFVRSNYSYLRDNSSRLFSNRNLNEYLKFNIRHYGFNQILHYEDHSSMQHSVEIRSPFIDYRMMELAFSLPTKLKFDMGVTKRILRHALRGRLPDEIINKHRKIGFVTPFNRWLQDPRFGAFVNDVIGAESFMSKKIWNAKKIHQVFAKQEANERFPFWRILNLELWSKAYNVNNL